MGSSAPAYAANDGVIDAARAALGAALVEASDCVGEVALHVEREALAGALRMLRDTPGLEYQQLMEIAGVDYPERAERFEVVYCLLSLTRNHRIRVHVSTDEERPVPSVTGIWPNAGWLEREVYDMYGVLFEGNPDLRRILTDYGFRGHPQRKDFPLTGFTEMRYSEEAKRVVYEPVQLAQDFRSFDFLSPWEGAAYTIPGDEKARQPQAKGAATPVNADELLKADLAKVTPSVDKPKTTERPGQSGAGEPADSAAERRSADATPHKAAEEDAKSEDAAPKPTDAGAPPRPEKDDA